MVGPSITDADRDRFLRRLRVGFAAFVGVSMGLTVFAQDGDPLALVAAVLVGAVIGGVLAWWVFPDSIGTGPRG